MSDQWLWRDAVVRLLERTRLGQADDLAPAVNAAIAPLGIDITIYLVDHEQRMLRPVPERGKAVGEPLTIDATLAGRAFMFSTALSAPPVGHGRSLLWMPLLDGSERLGVLRIDGEGDVDDAEFRGQANMLGALLAHLIMIKMVGGDILRRTRRTRRMSAASELLWRLIPPLTYACERFVISAVFEPCYEVGGDGFDYAVDDDIAFAAICDATGHGLTAGMGTAVLLSAMRAARIAGDDLHAMGRAVDAEFAHEFSDARFATAVLLQLDLVTGALRYVNAGHPPPVILRGGKAVGRLDGGRRLPLGLDDPRPAIAQAALQHGDRLLCFTDGVTEARGRDGEPFGEHRLVDLAERSAVDGLAAPETLRRLSHAVAQHLDGPPRDDATMLLIEWSHDAAVALLP